MIVIFVELGNSRAKEGYRDPTSDDPELVRYRDAGGERITAFVFPPELTIADAFIEVTRVSAHHFQDADDTVHGHALPVWVESDSPGLKALLAEHYGLGRDGIGRPANWGLEFGLHEDPTLLSAQMYAAQGEPVAH